MTQVDHVCQTAFTHEVSGVFVPASILATWRPKTSTGTRRVTHPKGTRPQTQTVPPPSGSGPNSEKPRTDGRRSQSDVQDLSLHKAPT